MYSESFAVKWLSRIWKEGWSEESTLKTFIQCLAESKKETLPFVTIMRFCLQGQQKFCFKPQMWLGMFRKKGALKNLSTVARVHWNSEDGFQEVHLTIVDCETVVEGESLSSCVSVFTDTLGDVQTHSGALFNFQKNLKSMTQSQNLFRLNYSQG